ncbi:hypothetical protein BJV82DRAFT_670906 [Fennellomyces sp. T-0311]|nr:hypothetical protein BJV82DRAFT_670906 [Fennellomyces sp. T-0311]
MVLGTFALVNRRWKPSYVVHSDYETYTQLARVIPREIFESRMRTIKQLVLKEFPHVWIETHLFVLAMALVIAAAVFAIIARALAIALWYPLCILILPAIIAYWTTRRRGLKFIKLSKFHDSLQECLKKLTVMDTNYQIRWTYRRLKDVDTSESLGLRSPLSSHAITLVIEVTQVDNSIQRRSDILPTYDSVQQDIVLDVGPPAMEERLAFPPPVYRRHESLLPPSYRESLQSPSIMPSHAHLQSPSVHASQVINIPT